MPQSRTAGPPPVPAATSRQIVVARVFCIFCMIYVHFPAPQTLTTDLAPLTWPVVALFEDVLGRSSVPALSVISGFLISCGFARTRLGPFAWNRFRTLYVPAVFWAALPCVAAWTAHEMLSYDGKTYEMFFSEGPLALVAEHLLYLYGRPAIVPLIFLRDLFVTGVMVFGLRMLLGRWFFLTLPVWIAIAAADLAQPFILRPTIPAYVIAGMIAQQAIGHLVVPRGWFLPLTAAVAVYWSHETWGTLAALETALPELVWTLLFRTVVTLWTLSLALRIAERDGPLTALARNFEGSIYLAYLSHMFLFTLAWIPLEPLVEGRTMLSFAIFLVAPALILLIACGGMQVLRHAPRWLAIAMSGKPPGVRAPRTVPGG